MIGVQGEGIVKTGDGQEVPPTGLEGTGSGKEGEGKGQRMVDEVVVLNGPASPLRPFLCACPYADFQTITPSQHRLRNGRQTR